jgi:hypothetical protein
MLSAKQGRGPGKEKLGKGRSPAFLPLTIRWTGKIHAGQPLLSVYNVKTPTMVQRRGTLWTHPPTQWLSILLLSVMLSLQNCTAILSSNQSNDAIVLTLQRRVPD